MVRMQGERNPHMLLVKMQTRQPLWKSVWKFLKKLKIELLYDPDIPLLGIYLKEFKSTYNRSTCTLTFITALFITAKL
jgi:hypothetical protein